MGLIDDYSWICVKTLSDSQTAYKIEQIFYKNDLPVQVRESEDEYAIWVPMKYKDLSTDVIDNHLADNLAEGFVRFKDKPSPEDKIHIGRNYERKAPPKFYFFLILIGLFLLLLRLTYGIDFL